MLETKIESYFNSLELPDTPTIYDFLLLSLTEKDLIISFNWDDLLLQARKRVQRITKNLPQMVFLHGNIGMGYCRNDNGYGLITNKCNICNCHYEPSQLLYPIKHKDYKSSSQLQEQWKIAKNYIANAGYLTIFGYGLPTTDVEVKELLLNAFIISNVKSRFFDRIEIIDKPGFNEVELYNRRSEERRVGKEC